MSAALIYPLPALTNPVTIPLGAGYQKVDLPADRDAVLVMPPGGRTGGLDIVMHGRSFALQGEGGSGRVQVGGSGQNAILAANLRCAEVDAYHVEAAIKGGLYLPRVRVETSGGSHAGIHVDCLQIGDAARIKSLVIELATLRGDYQGLIAGLRRDGTGIRKLYMSKVNFRAGTNPDAGYKPLYLGDADQTLDPPGSPNGRMLPFDAAHLNDVYVEVLPGRRLDWHAVVPAAGMTRGGVPVGAISTDGGRTCSWASAMNVKGHVVAGIPPGGDYAPAPAG